MHLEVLGPVTPRPALHEAPQGVRSGPLRSPRRLRTRLPTRQDAHEVINTNSYTTRHLQPYNNTTKLYSVWQSALLIVN